MYTNLPLPVKSEDFENVVPQIGDKKKLVDLSLKNALYQKRDKEISKEEQKSKKNKVLHIMQENLLAELNILKSSSVSTTQIFRVLTR